MNFNEFSKIIQMIDYLIELEGEGRDIWPILVSWELALKLDKPEFAERLD